VKIAAKSRGVQYLPCLQCNFPRLAQAVLSGHDWSKSFAGSLLLECPWGDCKVSKTAALPWL
jgi:hypothetical protein